MADELVEQYDILLKQGETRRWQFQVGVEGQNGSNFVPTDITGWTAKGQIRKSKLKSSPLLAEFTFDIEGPEGNVNATLSAAQTDALKTGGWYDIEVTSASGDVVRIAQGKVRLDRAVTQ